MSDALVYGTEIAVGVACGITGVILVQRKAWLFGGILATLSLLAVGHAIWALLAT